MRSHSEPGGSHLPPAILLDVDCMTGLQTARTLARRGVEVRGIARDTSHYACRSRYLSGVTRYDGSESDLRAAIERVAAAIGGEAAMVMPCSDATVRGLSRARDELDPRLRFVLPGDDLITQLQDKSTFLAVATEMGVPVPATVVAEPGRLAVAASELVFPIVVKPAVKGAAWDEHISTKVVSCAGRTELLDLVASLPDDVGPLVAQEWIPGGEDRLYSCNVYFDRSGQPLVSFVARKIRQWPPHAGTSASGIEVDEPEVAELALDLFDRVGWRGLGYIETKSDPRTGRHVVIEPNLGRPTGRSAIAEGGNVELVFTAYCDAIGLPVPPNRQQSFVGVKWIYLRHDVQAAISAVRRGELSPLEWFRSIKGPKVFAVWDPSDPVPFAFDLLTAVWKLLTGATRSVGRRVPR